MSKKRIVLIGAGSRCFGPYTIALLLGLDRKIPCMTSFSPSILYTQEGFKGSTIVLMDTDSRLLARSKEIAEKEYAKLEPYINIYSGASAEKERAHDEMQQLRNELNELRKLVKAEIVRKG